MSQYGHYHSDNGASPNAVLVSETFGPNIRAMKTEGGALEGVAHATWSTAPFLTDRHRSNGKKTNPNAALCSVEGCRAFADKTYGTLCNAHGRWEGHEKEPKREHIRCSIEGCRGSATKKYEGLCGVHGYNAERKAKQGGDADPAA